MQPQSGVLVGGAAGVAARHHHRRDAGLVAALGEFGPILVFSGATRLRTEVLPTTVFLELSVGNLETAVAVSLLMVMAALIVLVIVRVYGMERTPCNRSQTRMPQKADGLPFLAMLSNESRLMIAVADLSVRAGAFMLEGISFTASASEYVVLMGKTGCGKTTLLEAICGLKPVRAGSIHLHGRDVTRREASGAAASVMCRRISLVSHLDGTRAPRLRLDSAALGSNDDGAARRRVQRDARHRSFAGAPAARSQRRRAQRVALGPCWRFGRRSCCWMNRFSALDDETRADMAVLLRSVRKLTGVTTLHVTHSLGEAKKLADRLLILKNGVIEEMPNESNQGAGP